MEHLALAYGRLGDTENKIRAFREAHARDPHDARYATALGEELAARAYGEGTTGHIADEMRDYGDALAVHPTPALWRLFGSALDREHHTDAAEDAFRHGVSMDGNDANLREALGAVLLQKAYDLEASGEHERSVADVSRSGLGYAPSVHVGWFDLGLGEAALSHWSEAVTAFRRARTLAPDNDEYRDSLARSLLEQASALTANGQIEQAQAATREATQLMTPDGGAHADARP